MLHDDHARLKCGTVFLIRGNYAVRMYNEDKSGTVAPSSPAAVGQYSNVLYF